MSTNPTNHSGWGNTGHDPITGSLTRRLGAPGKYYNAVAVTNITQSFNSESDIFLVFENILLILRLDVL